MQNHLSCMSCLPMIQTKYLQNPSEMKFGSSLCPSIDFVFMADDPSLFILTNLIILIQIKGKIRQILIQLIMDLQISFWDSKSQVARAVKDLLLGGTAAALVKLCMAPYERVKLIKFMRSSTFLQNKQEVPPQSSFKLLQQMVKAQGFFSLWQGSQEALIHYVPIQALNFSVHEYFRGKLLRSVDPTAQKIRYLGLSMLSGGLAGAVSLALFYPLDIVRTKMFNDHSQRILLQKKGLLGYAVQIIRNQGIQTLYKGYLISALGNFLYRSIYFGLYFGGKRLIWGEEDQKTLGFVTKMKLAIPTTLLAILLPGPIDEVRRKMSIGRMNRKTKDSDAFHFISKIYKERGLQGFFKSTLSSLHVRTGSAMMILVLFDEMKSKINVEND